MGGEWYYKVMGQEAGPVSPSELKDLAESGFLGPDVLVRKGADGDWIPAGQVSGLFGRTFQPEAAEPPKPPPADAGPQAKAVGNAGASPSRAAAQPPSEPQPADADWYCRVMGKEIGPLSRTALGELAASGFLAPGALVREGIDGEWIPTSEVSGLFDEAPPEMKGREPDLAGTEPASPEKPATPDKRGDSSQQAPHKTPSKLQASDAGWYCQVMGEETGPLSSAQLKELAASGFLTPHVPVRKGVNGSWVPASRVRGLFPGASQAPAEGKAGLPAAPRPDSKPSSTSDPHAKRAKASASPAPPRPPAAPIVWYYRAMGEETGPLSSGDLKELAKSGLLTPDMPVRMGIDGDWLPAGQVLGLFGEPSKPAPTNKAKRPTGPAGAARRSTTKSDPGPTRKTVAGPAPEAPARPPKQAAPRPPSRPTSRPATPPTAPVASQPVPASGMADFLDEALAEPTPGGSEPADVYATLPVEPATRPPMLSPTPDPAAFESRTVTIGSGYDSRKKRSMADTGSIAGGLGLMLGAALWFFGGLAGGYIYYFPPFAFLFGLFVFFKGLFGAIRGGD